MVSDLMIPRHLDIASLDLQKAFDTVNHDVLLVKLNHYEIREIGNNWFCLFLSDRMQFTSINKLQS